LASKVARVDPVVRFVGVTTLTTHLDAKQGTATDCNASMALRLNAMIRKENLQNITEILVSEE
jgi:hypothetical protein